MAHSPKREATIRRFVIKKRAIEVTEDEAREFDKKFRHMRSSAKRIRENFCREYIKDYNASAAVLRMGFKGKFHGQFGSRLVRDPYTQFYLGQLVEKLEKRTIVTENVVLTRLMREAHLEGRDASHAARVSALRTLAKCLGLEITKVEGSMAVEGGVMMVPFTGSLEDWEKNAASSQAKLKETVRK